ncbi:ankyrin repeat domain-containing protein 20B isoform X1 [Cricetulus griseus]|uniref:ankyrin repeat domain-containing protein 20B isoform X1 n=1 Tax=Cricetulus griseus TaxID=10029 RepID=UPI0015C3EA90|nr:ankyrin repeat domain-containing protein 20B isoform X1 [Cricetulus griseus]
MKKFLTIFSQRRSSSVSSTSQRPRCRHRATRHHSTTQPPKYEAYGKIHKAARLGDVARVQCRLELAKNGANDRDRNSRTPLHYACAHGHPDVVTLLLDWNCDIDLCDSYNSTPLIKASQYDHEECMTILLEHGANPNATDNSGSTALHYAVFIENISMTTKLLEYNADANITNKGGVSPLILAQLGSNENLTKLLVSHIKKIQEVDEPDRTPSGSNSCGSSSPKEAEDKVTEKTEKHNVNKVDTSENLNFGAAASALQIQDEKAEDQQITVENQVNDGSVMETFEAKNKVKEISNTFDPNKFVLPYERNSKDCEMLSFDKILSLIEQLMRDSKDSPSLMRISSALHSYRKSLELKTHDFELLQERHKNLKINLSAIQKKVSKTVKGKLKVDTENTKLKAEMHNLRLKLENSDLQATTKYQAEETEQTQETQITDGVDTGVDQLTTLVLGLVTCRFVSLTDLPFPITMMSSHVLSCKVHSCSDEQGAGPVYLLSSPQCQMSHASTFRISSTVLPRLKLENSDLQATTKHKAEENEQIQKTQNELIQLLAHGLKIGKGRNSELQKEITRLKLENSDLQATTKHQAEESEQIQTTQNELIRTLTQGLEDGNKRNTELEKEITRLKLENSDLRATTKHEAEETEQIGRIQNDLIQSLTHSFEDEKKRNTELEKEIIRLKLENSDLRATTKHEAEETEQIGRIQNDLIQSLTHSFEDEKKRNTELEKEIIRLKLENSDLQATTKHEAEEIEQNRRTQTSEITTLLIRQNALIQLLTHNFEYRKRTNSELEKEVTRFKKQSDECENGEPAVFSASSTIHWEKEKRQAVPDKYKEQVMKMKQSIKDMQKEILGMKSREHSTKVSLEMYKQFYIAELNAREVLKEEHANLSSTNKRLQHENSRLAFEITKYRHVYNHEDRDSATTGISDGNLQNDFWTLQNRNTCWKPLFPNESLESPLGGKTCWGNLM